MTAAPVEMILSTLTHLGLYSANPNRRDAAARELAGEGFTAEHVAALAAKCAKAHNPGALCATILASDWREELGAAARAKSSKRDATTEPEWKAKFDESVEADLKARAQWNGVDPEVQRVEDRRGKVWELLTRSHWTPQQIAAHMGGTVDDVLADLSARGARYGRTLAEVLETSDPVAIKRNIEKLKRKSDERRRTEERKAAEALRLADSLEPKPAPAPASGPCLPLSETEIESARERASAFWKAHLAKTDRAWAERFGRALRAGEPETFAKMVSGPEPDPWIRQRVSAPIDKLFRDVWAESEAMRRPDGAERKRGRRQVSV